MPIPTNQPKPIRKTAKETAYNQLQEWIIDGTLLPGEKLIDSELAETLGVSRTPIREALQLLESQGFVKMFPGKATQVTEVDKESINDLLPPLAVLQALAAELAIPKLGEDDLILLEQTNKRFENAVDKKIYFSALKIDEQFHQIIVDIADNPYINKVLASLQSHVRRLFFHNSIILTRKSVDDHEEIISLLRKKDVKAVSETMRRNWIRTVDDFK
ncbi:GntR family transcriptional regulator [Bacillaceae bacterium W0354]